jgi:Fur family ferric uptake transcriptional regulator
MTDPIRPTRQRRVVARVLDDLSEFRSAQEIHALLAGRGESVGLATVYRTLQLLAETDDVDAIRSDAGEIVYRRCSASHHHHHLVCRSCGKTVEIEGPAVERWADAQAAKYGFTSVSHTLEIFGDCATCT